MENKNPNFQGAEEEEIFEIVDYTTASDWERFIARIEEILSDWKLNGPEISNNDIDFIDGEWFDQSELVEFGAVSYTLSHFYLQKTTTMKEQTPPPAPVINSDKQNLIPPRAMADMMSRRNDFPTSSPFISHWFGVREFLILSRTRNDTAVLDEGQANVLLSSAAIAVSNVGCNIPIFVRVQHEWRNMFIGLCEGSGLRTYFNVCHLKSVPHQYRHLSGLLEIFKSKLGSQIPAGTIVMVAVRFTYVQKDFESTALKQLLARDDTGLPILHELPFGSFYDPVSGIHLSCTWPLFSEESVTENEDSNDFDPLLSQHWTMGATLVQDLPVLLSQAVDEYFKLTSRRETIEQLLGKLQSNEDHTTNTLNTADPIKRISDSRTQQYLMSISSSISNRTKRLRVNMFDPPLPTSVVERTIEYLFDNRPTTEETSIDIEEIRRLKSVPNDSFVHRLVICFLTICSLSSYNHLRSIAHLWCDVLQEIRNRWEIGELIPGLESGSPNLSYSKFYQNLQMLNCCIEYRVRRQKEANICTENKTNTDMEVINEKTENDDDDDELFYECETNSNLVDIQPEGRLKPYGDLKLLDHEEILYVPLTQECPPATEDMLDEQTTVLTNLGSSEEATLLRAKMQSRSLLSDMESFKAANPLAKLEDFVRWYSPRDWIENEFVDENGVVVKQASLSPRMQLPDNLWVEVWQQARPIPARRQKRLFDDGKEAEKILQKLSLLTPGEVLEELISAMIQTVCCRINQDVQELDEDNVLAYYQNLQTKAVSVVKSKEGRRKRLQEDFVDHLKSIEQYICRIKSFKEKLFPADLKENEREEMTRLIIELQARPEISIKGAANSQLGQQLVAMFSRPKSTTVQDNMNVPDTRPTFISPAGKEYILRASIGRPSHSRSRPSPQRMYCMLKSDEFRLCGAFSEDTTFF